MRLIIAGVALAAAALVAVIGRPPSAATPASIDGPPAGIDMVKTFDEEFDASTIDRKRWNLTYGPRIHGEAPIGSRSLWSNGEAQIYFDGGYLGLGIDPFSFADGSLVITARPLSAAVRDRLFGDLAHHPELLTGMKTPPRIEFSSGAITTRDMFQQRYGYFEMRASWSGGKGVWPAFWLLPANGAWPPEIDVVEAHGDKPGIAFQSVHSGSAPSVTLAGTVGGSQETLHAYGVLWMPGRLDFFVDGVKTNSIPETPDMKQPMYLIANLAIGGYWPGYPDPGAAFAATMRIDHIRAWQFRHVPVVDKQ